MIYLLITVTVIVRPINFGSPGSPPASTHSGHGNEQQAGSPSEQDMDELYGIDTDALQYDLDSRKFHLEI